MKAIDLISAILIGAALAQPQSPCFGQRCIYEETISISPAYPTTATEVISRIQGEVGLNDTIIVEYERENNTLITRLYFQWAYEIGWAPPIDFRHNWGRFEEGDYNLAYEVYWAPYYRPGEFERGDFEFDTTFTVLGPGEAIVELSQGWNLISSHVNPSERDIPALFSPLLEEGSLLLVKDQYGRFFHPGRNFNSIPGWDYRRGYMVKVARATTLLMEGLPVSPDSPIPLRLGWNLISYLPEEAQEAPEAFEPIVDILELAKDGSGRFYNPGAGFNNLERLHRGNGYLLKVTAAREFRWR